jgi:hypothetical protein
MSSLRAKPSRSNRLGSLQALAAKALKDPNSLMPDEIRRLGAAAVAKLEREREDRLDIKIARERISEIYGPDALERKK